MTGSFDAPVATLVRRLRENTPGETAEKVDETIVDCQINRILYGEFLAVRDTNVPISRGKITAFIGPSGCGKSTVLRSINRMNDLVDGFHMDGKILFAGQDVYAPATDPVVVRRFIGMVFQEPNPFVASIYGNVAYGLSTNGSTDKIPELVEKALRRAALWDEVKDNLDVSALCLSGGQQQRLCIARAIATEPDVLLMDEPCSALDPINTRKIEHLLAELKKHYTIVIVTHNLQQALRVADMTAFLYVDTFNGDRTGYLVEYRDTKEMFEDPREESTKQYLRGEFS